MQYHYSSSLENNGFDYCTNGESAIDICYGKNCTTSYYDGDCIQPKGDYYKIDKVEYKECGKNNKCDRAKTMEESK
jgi:hypothetical protein